MPAASPACAPAPVAELAYWRLIGGELAGEVRPIAEGEDAVGAMIADATAGLERARSPRFDDPRDARTAPGPGRAMRRATATTRISPASRNGRSRWRANERRRPTTAASTAAERQREAADGRVSVWVAASAGTGKTKVLTDRVLNLMLRGSAAGTHPLPHLHQGRRRGDGEPHQPSGSAHWTTLGDGALAQELAGADRRDAEPPRCSSTRAGCSPACSTRRAA